MDREFRLVRHPARQQLVAYAENLVDRNAPVSAAMASHLSVCAACAAELRAIRTSLEFASTAQSLAPSTNLTSQILMQAKKERSETRGRRNLPRVFWSCIKGAACAGALAACGFFSFSMALNAEGGVVSTTSQFAPQATQTAAAVSAESLKRASADIRSLSAAFRLDPGRSRTLHEREQLRVVSALGADIEAAKAALARNPGCVRATHIVHANIQRQAETLREMYIEHRL